MAQSTNFEEVRNQCGKVLDYFRGLGNLAYPPRSNFESAVAWFRYGSQLRGLPGIRFDESACGEEAWLTVPRQREETMPPPLPNALKGWVNDHDDPEKDLAHEKIRGEGAPDSPNGENREVLRWQDDAPANRAWEAYVPKWREWRDSERPKRRAAEVYKRLHEYCLAVESGRPLEILFGMGIAKQHSGKVLECNCIVVEQMAELEMDAKTSNLIIRPRRGRRPAVSLGHFHKNPHLRRVESALGDKLADNDWDLNPHMEGSFLPIVETARSYLDASARIRRDVSAPDDKPEQLTFYPEWVVAVRNREEAGILSNAVKSFKEEVNAAESLNDLPDALIRVISGVSGAGSLAEENPLPFHGKLGGQPKNRAATTPPDIAKLYFPLPCNDEQRRIMSGLQRPECRGMVVQGPPGTGKSHTIANIISHCLATGQKVLVASHNSPALEVVREKIPEGIRKFAIPVLSTERKSRKEIAVAVDALAKVRAETDLSTIGAEIERMEEEAERLSHGELPRMRNEMIRLAKRQLEPLPEALATGMSEPSSARLAQWVADNRDHLRWFKDLPECETLASMPFDDSDIRRMRDARRALGENLSPTILTAMKSEGAPVGAPPDMEQMRADRLDVERVPWAAALLRNRLAGVAEMRPWSEHRSELRVLAQQRDDIARKPVTHPNLEAALSNEVVDALEKKAKIFALPVTSGEVRNVLGEFRVEGRKPRGTGDWRLVRDYVRWLLDVRAFATRWNANIAPNLSGRGVRIPKPPGQHFAWIGKSDDTLRRMESILGIVGELRGQVVEIAQKIEQAGAPLWAAELRTRPVVGDDSLLPENWRDAWRWGCANKYLDDVDGGKRMRQLADDILHGENDLSRLMGEIVEKRAAEAITRELDKDIEAASSLSTFQTAMREAPKTPGAKNAPRFRNMAQQAMEKCHRAIPCWIMPSWRANEMLPAKFGAFDLVIVDEASQSDITEIATLSRGKRVLVVGDNEQVSPLVHREQGGGH